MGTNAREEKRAQQTTKATPPEHERKREERAQREARHRSDQRENEPAPPDDKVDEASWESFPASDPPSFTPQKVG